SNVTCTAARNFIPLPSAGPSSAPPNLFLESLGYITQDMSAVGQTGIQQQLWSIEDRLQGHSATPPRPLGFTDEQQASDPTIDSAFAALGYSDPKSPMAVKAPPPQPTTFSYSAWTQGFVDYENRTGTFDGIDVGRNTLMGGGLAAADVTIQGVTSASDAVVFGLL